MTTPKGQMIPQTVDSLQRVMAKDATMMEAMGREIAELRKHIAKQEVTIATLLKQRDQARGALREQSSDQS